MRNDGCEELRGGVAVPSCLIAERRLRKGSFSSQRTALCASFLPSETYCNSSPQISSGNGMRSSRRALRPDIRLILHNFFCYISRPFQPARTDPPHPPPISHASRYKQESRRKFSMFTSFGLSFSVLGLLPSIATTLWYGLGFAGTAGMFGGTSFQALVLSSSWFLSSSRTTRHMQSIPNPGSHSVW